MGYHLASMATRWKTSGQILDIFSGVGQFVLMVSEVLIACFRLPFRPWLLLQQMEFVGVGSLFIILLTGAFSGAVFTLQSVYAFSMFDMESMVGATVTLAMTRELSPVLTSLMITGRLATSAGVSWNFSRTLRW